MRMCLTSPLASLKRLWQECGSGPNPSLSFFVLVLSDRETQIRGRMLLAALRPTYESYKEDVKEQKTVAGCMRREASNALGDWAVELNQIADTIHDGAVLRRLAITIPKEQGQHLKQKAEGGGGKDEGGRRKEG